METLAAAAFGCIEYVGSCRIRSFTHTPTLQKTLCMTRRLCLFATNAVGSAATLAAWPFMGGYASSKAALGALTNALR